MDNSSFFNFGGDTANYIIVRIKSLVLLVKSMDKISYGFKVCYEIKFIILANLTLMLSPMPTAGTPPSSHFALLAHHKFHRVRQSIVAPLKGIFIASEAARIAIAIDAHRLG
jgi:hypothetical protein